jgi:hypothetical protein
LTWRSDIGEDRLMLDRTQVARRGRRWLLLVVTIAAVCVATAVPVHAGRLASTCAYVQTGAPGPRGNVLRIEVGDFGVTLTREGSRLKLPKVRGEVDCAGRTPTVRNIDRITIVPRDPGSPRSLVLNLANGPIGPGATPERRGAEIEIQVEGIRRIAIGGSRGRNVITLGNAEGGGVGVNLNVAADGRRPDVDLVASNPKPAEISVDGRAGDDRLSAQGGRGFASELRLNEVLSLEGDRGDDLLLGSPEEDALREGSGDDVARGGRGRDRIAANKGLDTAFGGPGNDTIDLTGVGNVLPTPDERGPDRAFAGRGNDLIQSIDRGVDIDNCGPGRDAVNADDRDRLIACE